MCLAIEPMLNQGSEDIITKKDGWTVCTLDGKPSAHFEHTVAVTEKGVEILNLDIAKPLNKKHEPYWKKCNINNALETKKLFLEYKPTHIIHLAAGTGMDVSDINHFRTNFDGVQSLINVCNDIDTIEKVVFTSSLLVCARSYVPVDDEDYKPDCLYGESKVLSELIVRKSNMNVHGFDLLIQLFLILLKEAFM